PERCLSGAPRECPMSAKQILFHKDAHDKILAGMGALANAVRAARAPNARRVVLERAYGPPAIINSGVVVAKEIELEDRFENMGAQMGRGVGTKTSDVAGG